MASLAVSLAIANPHITASVIEANEYPDFAQRYQVYGVPRTVINEKEAIEGAVPPGQLIDKVITAGKGASASS
jgi:predicted DsbA family dithiol-disulfide isomerase